MKQIAIHQFTGEPVAGKAIPQYLLQNTPSGSVEIVARNGSAPIITIPKGETDGIADYLASLSERPTTDHAANAKSLRRVVAMSMGVQTIEDIEGAEQATEMSVGIDPETRGGMLAVLKLLKNTAHYEA